MQQFTNWQRNLINFCCKGVSELKASLNYSYHPAKSCENYIFLFSSAAQTEPFYWLRHFRQKGGKNQIFTNFLHGDMNNLDGPNVSTTPLRQWGFRQCLTFSWTTLRGKHCRHPIAVMGVVDTFGLCSSSRRKHQENTQVTPLFIYQFRFENSLLKSIFSR